MESADRLVAALAQHYRVEREVGAGGMATVYLAEDLKHHRRVAVKVLRPELAATLGPERFAREIEIAAQLQHPHILPLLDSGDAQGFLYYVMPFVEGESLRQRLARHGELPVQEAVRLLVEVADALAYAHGRGLVHRDIKPENIMLSGRHALVTDFGVAKAVSEATGRQSLTTGGMALGTPVYMAPEQATADPQLDHRVDIYALGILAYELLTGRPPFTGSTPQQILAAHLTEMPEPLSKHRPGVPAALEQAVMKCLAKRPADRWQDAEELLAQLEPLATPSGATTPTNSELMRGMPARGRRPVAFAVLGVMLAALLAGAVWRLWPTVQPVAIGKTRRITSAPGLEIQPTVSPDGKLVAYAAAAAPGRINLFVQQLAGGRTIPLTDGVPGSHRLPAWSPDGAQLLYVSELENRSIPEIIPALGGAPRQLMEHAGRYSINGVAWSPAGDRIAISVLDTLYEQASGGGPLRRIAVSEDMHSLAWSPDGKWLAYVSGNSTFSSGELGFGNIAPSVVFVVPATGGVPVALTDSTNLNLSPVWLPGSRDLLFVSDRDGSRDIYQARLDRTGRPAAPPLRLTTGLEAQSLSLAPGGKTLVYSTYMRTANIWTIRTERGRVQTSAAAVPVTEGSQTVEAVDLSPDGRWLAFDSDVNGNADIYVMSVEGGAARQLTTDPAGDFAPAWSRDGREIAFHSFRTGNRDIFVVSANGGNAEQVTTAPASERLPRWSPDGASLIFVHDGTKDASRRNAATYVVSRDRAGRWGTPRRLATGGFPGMSWSPDGKLIAYASIGKIQVIPPEGGTPRDLVVATPSQITVGVPRWSRDGRTLFYQSMNANGEASYWSLPAAGGEPRLLVHFDDPLRQPTRRGFGTDGERFFFTVADHQSDLWAAEIDLP